MTTLEPLDLDRPSRLGTGRRVVALLALAAVAVAWWQVLAATDGLTVTTVEQDGVPMDLLVPDDAVDAPGVVVAHGFAGSRQLMRATALALADAGSVVAVPDLSGHGANTSPLPTDDDGGQLARDVLAAVTVLEGTVELADGPVALLGHSMGSGAVLRAALEAPERVGAVVAVSPTDAAVTPQAPGDLLLLAGELEPRFVANATSLLERAGGPRGPGEDGPRRELVVIDGVEHVSILFAAEMHRRAAVFLAETAGRTLEQDPVESSLGGAGPLGWWALHLVAVLVLWRALVPLLVDRGTGARTGVRTLLAATLGALAATATLAIVGSAVDLTGFGGMLVAPVLAIWFAIAGAVWLAVGPRPDRFGARDLIWAALLVLVLALALAALGSRAWLPVVPGGSRTLLLPAFVVVVLPWTVALATSLQGHRGLRAALWWVVVLLLVTVGLGIAAAVVPALGFLVLLLPLVPVLLTVAAVVWAPLQRPWAGGLATAVLLGWMLAVLFPLT
jgi:pimeloyl-ACP methyl ester carboxylesterase